MKSALRLVAAILIAKALLVSCVANAGDNKNPLIGDWEVISITQNGRPLTEPDMEFIWFQVTETEFIAHAKVKGKMEEARQTARFLGDGKMDLIQKNANFERVTPALYEIKDGKLKIATATAKVITRDTKLERPKDFKDSPQTAILTAKRKPR